MPSPLPASLQLDVNRVATCCHTDGRRATQPSRQQWLLPRVSAPTAPSVFPIPASVRRGVRPRAKATTWRAGSCNNYLAGCRFFTSSSKARCGLLLSLSRSLESLVPCMHSLGLLVVAYTHTHTHTHPSSVSQTIPCLRTLHDGCKMSSAASHRQARKLAHVEVPAPLPPGTAS